MAESAGNRVAIIWGPESWRAFKEAHNLAEDAPKEGVLLDSTVRYKVVWHFGSLRLAYNCKETSTKFTIYSADIFGALSTEMCQMLQPTIDSAKQDMVYEGLYASKLWSIP